MEDEIRAELSRVEAKDDVRVLYAVESGSRAAGGGDGRLGAS